jgi:hypothetical protein
VNGIEIRHGNRLGCSGTVQARAFVSSNLEDLEVLDAFTGGGNQPQSVSSTISRPAALRLSNLTHSLASRSRNSTIS